MSYCRIGADSDVYVFRNMRGNIEIMTSHRIDGQLGGRTSAHQLEGLAVARLHSLRLRGLKVPDRCFERLFRDICPITTTTANSKPVTAHSKAK